MAEKYLAPREVKTERLLLRPLVLADHARYSTFSADPEVMRYMGTGVVSTPEVAWRSMSGLLGHWEMLGYGIWAIDLPGTGVIGHAGYIDVPGWPGFELAWMLGRDYWGQGYAREAAGMALKIAYDSLKKDRVISLIRPANAPSIKLAQSLGAVKESETELLGSVAEVYVHRKAE